VLAHRRTTLLLTTAALVAVASAAMLVGGLASAAPNPAGNNGTIKVDALPFDDASNNEPHVDCSFQVDFYGFDEGDLTAEVTFEAHPPTGPVQTLLTDTVFIGEDDNSGGGSEAGLDASETYTLDFGTITPHPQQGFHVKLTINAEGSQGADTKHKVFWVTPCPAPTTTTTTTTTLPPSSSSTSTSTTTTTEPPASSSTSTTTSTTEPPASSSTSTTTTTTQPPASSSTTTTTNNAGR
jgi:hypothetical protein